MNDILDIGSENSPYSKDTDDKSSICFSGLSINNSYISEYLLAFFGESKVTVANLNKRLAEANERARIYIDELINSEARPERKLQSIEEIKKQLNKLIPERLRELQKSGAPAYRTKSKKASFEAFDALLKKGHIEGAKQVAEVIWGAIARNEADRRIYRPEDFIIE